LAAPHLDYYMKYYMTRPSKGALEVNRARL